MIHQKSGGSCRVSQKILKCLLYVLRGLCWKKMSLEDILGGSCRVSRRHFRNKDLSWRIGFACTQNTEASGTNEQNTSHDVYACRVSRRHFRNKDLSRRIRFTKTSHDVYALLVLKTQKPVVQMILLHYFQAIFWYKSIVCFIPLYRVLSHLHQHTHTHVFIGSFIPIKSLLGLLSHVFIGTNTHTHTSFLIGSFIPISSINHV